MGNSRPLSEEMEKLLLPIPSVGGSQIEDKVRPVAKRAIPRTCASRIHFCRFADKRGGGQQLCHVSKPIMPVHRLRLDASAKPFGIFARNGVPCGFTVRYEGFSVARSTYHPAFSAAPNLLAHIDRHSRRGTVGKIAWRVFLQGNQSD